MLVALYKWKLIWSLSLVILLHHVSEYKWNQASCKLTCISTGRNDMLISFNVAMHLAAYDFDKLSKNLSGQAKIF